MNFTNQIITFLRSNKYNLGDSYTTNFIDQVLSYSKIEPQKVVNYFISSIYAKLNKEKIEIIRRKKLMRRNFAK